jgi:5-methylcytosine-specific restriction protein A
MPTLNISRKTKKDNVRNEHSPNRELRQKYYNTTEWRKLRETYIKAHPVCEECLNKGRVTPATSVHHKNSPFKNGNCNKSLFLDYNNLEAVCHECHSEIHNREQGHITVQDVIKQLADLLDPTITDEELE